MFKNIVGFVKSLAQRVWSWVKGHTNPTTVTVVSAVAGAVVLFVPAVTSAVFTAVCFVFNIACFIALVVVFTCCWLAIFEGVMLIVNSIMMLIVNSITSRVSA